MSIPELLVSLFLLAAIALSAASVTMATALLAALARREGKDGRW